MPAFFRMSDKKRGEMEREGSWRIGGWEEEERWRGCWHALVSNLFESIAQFICFVSTATAEDNQTRRPLDSSYCPPMHTPPLPHSLNPLHPPGHLFSCDMLTEGEARQFTSLPKWGNVRKGTHIKTRLSWRFSMVQKLQTNTYSRHSGYRIYTHTLLCTLINTFALWISLKANSRNTVQQKKIKIGFCLLAPISAIKLNIFRSPYLNGYIYKQWQLIFLYHLWKYFSYIFWPIWKHLLSEKALCLICVFNTNGKEHVWHY